MQGLFLSTLSLRRATIPDREPAAGYLISIHALLAESDPTRWAPTCRISNFYPRSPCGERLVALLATGRAGYFYPRSPCGERRRYAVHGYANYPISIHALLAESDISVDEIPYQRQIFLSTLSLRRATVSTRIDTGHNFDFYPRSPCGERPIALSTQPTRKPDFYPRSPCGERHWGTRSWRSCNIFLSTLSLRRATGKTYGALKHVHEFLSTLSLRRATRAFRIQLQNQRISIHALLAESDPMISETVWLIIVFLSTLSLRRATLQRLLCEANSYISIHALLAESDANCAIYY